MQGQAMIPLKSTKPTGPILRQGVIRRGPFIKVREIRLHGVESRHIGTSAEFPQSQLCGQERTSRLANPG